jgi:multiple sugar transport system substrate-binding protein
VSRRAFLKSTAATAGVIAGAALFGKAPAATKEVELHVLGWAGFVKEGDNEFDRQVQEWAKANRVKVKIERVGSGDIQTRMAAAVMTKAGPDVVHYQQNWAWLYGDSLADVGAVAEVANKEYGGFYPDMAGNCKVRGVWRAVPYALCIEAFNYRPDWFQQAGAKVPVTWDDFIEEGKKMKKFGKPFGHPLGHSESDPHRLWYSWLWAHGGKEVQEDGKTVAINSPQTLEAVKRAMVLYDEVFIPGVLSWDDSSNNRTFLAGVCSGVFNAASVYFVAKRDFPEVAKAMDHAALMGGSAGRYWYPGSNHLAVMGYSKNQKAAKDLVAHLTKAANVGKYLEVNGGFYQGAGPAFETLPVWEKDPKVRPFMENVKAKISRWAGWPGPPSAAASAAQSRFIVVDLFAKACSREFSPEDAVKWAEAQLKNIYKA